MAQQPNPVKKNGFIPIIRIGGAPFSVQQYAKPASDPSPLYTFDLLMKVAGGVPLPESPGYTLPAVRSAVAGTPGTTLWIGSTIGAYSPLLTLSYVPVADEVDCMFLAQSNGSVVVTTADTVGKNANVTNAAGIGRTSQMAINLNTVAVNAALDFRIRAVSMAAPNMELPGLPPGGAARALFEVTINKHFYAQATPGV